MSITLIHTYNNLKKQITNKNNTFTKKTDKHKDNKIATNKTIKIELMNKIFVQ